MRKLMTTVTAAVFFGLAYPAVAGNQSEQPTTPNTNNELNKERFEDNPNQDLDSNSPSQQRAPRQPDQVAPDSERYDPNRIPDAEAEKYRKKQQ